MKCGRNWGCGAVAALCALFLFESQAQDFSGASRQWVVESPYPSPYHQEAANTVLENSNQALVLGGTSHFATDEVPVDWAGFIAQIGEDGMVLDWSEYGANESGRLTAIDVLVELPEGELIAGGTMGGLGYLLRLDDVGEVLWSAVLEAEQVERVVSIMPTADGFLVVGESSYRTDVEGSGAYTVVFVDDAGVVGDAMRYGASQEEEIVDVVRVLGGAFQVYSYATSGPGTPKELWVRGFDGTGGFLWEKSLGTEPDYPVAGVHLTVDLNVILVRPRVVEGAFDRACRLQYIDQAGNRYRTRDLIGDIFGTTLVGVIQFGEYRFGIVSYDSEATHVVVFDYQLGYFSRQSVPVDPALVPDFGALGPAVVRPDIRGMALRSNGNLVLAGALVPKLEMQVGEFGPASDAYIIELNSETLYLSFDERIRLAAVALLDEFDEADLSGDGTLRFYEASLVRPTMTIEMFRAMDLDGNNTLSYGEVESAAYNYYKYGPGGIAFCGTGEQRIGGDWALAFVMLAFLLFWGRRTGGRRLAR